MNEETQFLLKNHQPLQPKTNMDGLQVFYDMKGKKNTDAYKNKLLDFSGNGRHADLYNFAYKAYSGYHENEGLVFDGIDDKIVRPSLNDFTYVNTGKNLTDWDKELLNIGGANTTYLNENVVSIQPSGGSIKTLLNPIDFISGQSYTLSFRAGKVITDASNQYYGIGFSSLTKDYATKEIGLIIANGASTNISDITHTFTAPATFTATRFYLFTYSGVVTTYKFVVNSFMLEKNTVATFFEPYASMPLLTTQVNNNFVAYDTGTVKYIDKETMVHSNRNLVLNSHITKYSSVYKIHQYTLSEKYVVGQQYTITVKGKVNTGQGIGLWFNGSSNHQGYLTKIADELYRMTFTARIAAYGGTTYDGTSYDANTLSLYNTGGNPTSAVIEWVKLEKGVADTPWVPNDKDITSTIELKNNILGDMENLITPDDKDKQTGAEVFTDKAEANSVVHVDVDGKSGQFLKFREETDKTLTLTNHEESSLRKLEVYGESSQVVAEGNPTLIKPITSTDYSGSTATFNADGTVTLNSAGGNPSGSGVQPRTSAYVPCVGGQYTISYQFSSGLSRRSLIHVRDENMQPITTGVVGHGVYNAGYQAWYNTQNNKTFTLPETARFVAVGFIVEYVGETPIIDTLLWAKLEAGTTATPIPKPSPYYPSPISNVEAVGVYSGIGGRNLYSKNKTKSNMVGNPTVVNNELNGFTVTSTVESSSFRIARIVDGNGYYTFSAWATASSDDSLKVDFADSAKQDIILKANVRTRVVITSNVITYSPAIYHFFDFSSLSIGTIVFEDVKIEKGTTATPYTLAPEDIPIDTTTNNTYLTKPTLTAPLRKVGGVADRLFYDKVAGKWKVERKIGEWILNGSEAWTNVWSGVNTYPIYLLTSLPKSATYLESTQLVVANKLKAQTRNALYPSDDEGICVGGTTGYFALRVNRSRLTTNDLAGAKAWLSANPVTVQYELKTPTIETLPDGTLPPLFKPTTYLDTVSTLKGDLTAGYLLKNTATPLGTDIQAAPEYVNPIINYGDTQDEQYDVAVVSSVGKRNLLSRASRKNHLPEFSSWINNMGSSYASESIDMTDEWGDAEAYQITTTAGTNRTGIHRYVYNLDFNKTYTYSVDFKNTSSFDLELVFNGLMDAYGSAYIPNIKPGESSRLTVTGVRRPDYNWFQIMPRTYSDDLGKQYSFIIANEKLEEGLVATPYSPAPEDMQSNTHSAVLYKTNLALSEPLRSLGTAKDRLFLDNDGLWKIERHIAERTLNGTETWKIFEERTQTQSFTCYKTANTFMNQWAEFSSNKATENIVSPYFKTQDSSIGEYNFMNAHSLLDNKWLWLNLDRKHNPAGTLAGFNSWLASRPVTIQYRIIPTLEVLPTEFQDRLNAIQSYANSNYVYTVPLETTSVTDQLIPTLQATFRAKYRYKENRLLQTYKIWNRTLSDSELLAEYKENKKRWSL